MGTAWARVRMVLPVVLVVMCWLALVMDWAPGRAATICRGPGGGAVHAVAPRSRSWLAETAQRRTSVQITVALAGDVLTHMPIVRSAYDAQTGDYDFSSIFLPLEPVIGGADYAVANLEVKLAGAERGFSGYPLLNSPAELAEGLAAGGFDLVGTANNHCLDMGLDGIVRTLDNLEASGLAHVGTYLSSEEQQTPCVVEVGGVNLGFLNYTWTLNGRVLPRDAAFAANLYDRDTIVEEAARARAAGADLVVALLHWGQEYVREPDRSQVDEAAALFQGGVDVIVGSHPHVVQPIERVWTFADGRVRDRYAAYSLGNFLSNQPWRYADSGVIFLLRIEKDEEGTFVRGVDYLPVYVAKGWTDTGREYHVLPAAGGWSRPEDVTIGPDQEARMAQVADELTQLLEHPEDRVRVLAPPD